MKIFKQTIEFLSSGEFFSGLIERMFALVVTISVFALVIICYIFKPVILLYLLIIGMLAMGWFMMYFIFPEAHEWVYSIRRKLTQALSKFKE